MHQDDINLAKGEIERAVRKTPYGDGLPLHISLLRLAIAEIESLRANLNEKDAELDRYRGRVDELNKYITGERPDKFHDSIMENSNMMARICAENERDSLRAKLAEAEKDAERYRWLRHGDNDESVLEFNMCSNCGTEDCWLFREEKLDEAIDAAIASQQSDTVDGRRGEE